MALIYLHAKKDNGAPFYVGIGKKQSRPFEIGSRRSEYHNRVVKKHGVDVIILADDFSWDEACWWEVRWIKALREAGYDLVNLTAGGDGVSPTEETREKMRSSANCRWSNPEQRRLTSEATKRGMDNPEVKEKISYMKGRSHNESTKLKISVSNKRAGQNPLLKKIRSENSIAEKNPFFGKKHSDESKAKMSAKLKGRVSPNKGRKFTEEHKSRLKDAWIKRRSQGDIL